MMKAYSLHAINDLRYEDVEYPECNSGWCIVNVKYSGICSSDVPRILKKGTYKFPTIPGHEFSGVVCQVADKENENLIGKHVGVFPLIPCKKCEQCMEGNYEMCSHYDYIGSRRDGGFAEYVAVPIWNLVELPSEIDLKEAAMMEPLAVALHAVKQANINYEKKVAVVGTGLIAFAIAQWAKLLGAKEVVVLGRSEEKRRIAEEVLELKYEMTADFKDEFDVVFEAVGSNQAINQAINYTNAGGHLVLMGNPEGDIQLSQNTYWRILRKQIKIIGSWNSSYEYRKTCDWTEVKEALANKDIIVEQLITHLMSKEELKNGLDIMYNHKEPYCKIMIFW